MQLAAPMGPAPLHSPASAPAPAPALVNNVSSDTRRQLDEFLATVERRAYRMAEFAVRHQADALDIVQDAMLKLVQNYAVQPPADWPRLFQRILQHRIIDHHRRQRGLRRLFDWLETDSDADPIAELPASAIFDPARQLQSGQAHQALLKAVAQLPARQQQAFLLRFWEGYSEADMAFAMGCSPGSVKTHLSRALYALRAQLQEHQP